MASNLIVNEIYGPIVQGEGPSLGAPAAFLRLAACNLACTWCDSKYTWDWKNYDKDEESHPMTTEQVVDAVTKVVPQTRSPILIISGGEPMLQQAKLVEVMSVLRDHNPLLQFEIETAGTLAPTAAFASIVTNFNVSPKLSHSGNEKAKRYIPHALNALQATGKARWKFVVAEYTDLDEVDELVNEHSLAPVYIMPEGVTPEVIARRTAELEQPVIAHGYNLTTRLHVLMHGDKRAV